MTIDEAIKRLERKDGDLQACLNCHQLAEWLRELKAHREAQVTDAVDRVTIKEYIDSFDNEQMTAEEYRQRMMQAFHNAGCGELIAVCVLPTEKEFEHLEWLLKNHYKKPCGDCVSRAEVFAIAWDSCLDLESDADTKEFCDKIKALPPVTPQQEPCEDCISRQAVLDTTICDGISCNECSFNICEDGQPGCLLKERVEKLPPVTPKAETVTEFADRCRECGAKYGKLLKQELCEGAIRRQEVLDALDKSKYSNAFCEEHHIDQSINLGMAHIVVNELKPVASQPCGDAISRKAVIEITAETGALETQARVKKLPPVTPQPKIGKWIDEKDGYGTRCSECGKWYSHSILTKQEVLYCSSCGAKMQEVKNG